MEKKNVWRQWFASLCRWQVLVTLVVLATFYRTLVVTVTIDNAVVASSIAVLLIALASFIIVVTFNRLTLYPALIAFVAVFPLSLIVGADSGSLPPGLFFALVCIAVVIILIFATLAIRERHSIPRKTMWFSCALEFVAIFLPLTGTVVGWW